MPAGQASSFAALPPNQKHAIQHLDSLRQSLRQLQKVGGEAVRGMTSAFFFSLMMMFASTLIPEKS
jgi:hypothetical protein